jgi:UDP-2,3-diacylglucosamine pyrophosphatase LpxH
MRYNAVFVSDAHIGSNQNPHIFLEFLKQIDANYIFLVGDLIDIVAQKEDENILKMIEILKNKQSKIIYLFGNHEKENGEFKKNFCKYIKNFNPQKNFIYNGIEEKIYIEHGDSFHSKDKFNKFLKQSLRRFKRLLFKNKTKKEQLKKKQGIYYKIKPVIKTLLYNSYVNYIFNQAKKNNCNIVICGHLHEPEIKRKKDITYINCGDWLKHFTYVVEDFNGNFKIKKFTTIS